METTSNSDIETRFALWHIPSSTLLVTTLVAEEVICRIESATADGIVLSDLMLNVERCGAVVGDQHIGSEMLVALQIAGACAPDT